MDPYSVLGLKSGASDDEVKSAWRKLVKEYHPDRFSGKTDEEKSKGEAKFKEVQEAYEKITKPQARADSHFRHDGSWAHVNSWGFGGFNFGHPARKKSPSAFIKSEQIAITLEESYLGAIKEVDYSWREICSDCNGCGGKDEEFCSHCNGSGAVTAQMGPYRVAQSCSVCEQTGKVFKDTCKSCNGQGRYAEPVQKKAAITIPKGSRSGEVIVLSVDSLGTISFTVSVLIHPELSRQGDHLIAGRELDFWQFVEGCKQEIKIPGETLEFQVPPGTKPGATLRIPRKGFEQELISRYMYVRGDLLVSLGCRIPAADTDSRRKAIEILKKEFS